MTPAEAAPSCVSILINSNSTPPLHPNLRQAGVLPCATPCGTLAGLTKRRTHVRACVNGTAPWRVARWLPRPPGPHGWGGAKPRLPQATPRQRQRHPCQGGASPSTGAALCHCGAVVAAPTSSVAAPYRGTGRCLDRMAVSGGALTATVTGRGSQGRWLTSHQWPATALTSAQLQRRRCGLAAAPAPLLTGTSGSGHTMACSSRASSSAGGGVEHGPHPAAGLPRPAQPVRPQPPHQLLTALAAGAHTRTCPSPESHPVCGSTAAAWCQCTSLVCTAVFHLAAQHRCRISSVRHPARPGAREASSSEARRRSCAGYVARCGAQVGNS